MNNLQRLRAERAVPASPSTAARRSTPAKVIRRFTYDHPVYTAAGVAAQARHAEISGVRRTHYCGAYWGWGFHEDGVLSADARLRADRASALARAAALSSRGAAGGVSASAVYEGWVRHRRFEPVEHAFRYRLFLMYLDLDELPERARPLPALLRPPPAPRPASAAPTSWATPSGRWPSAPATRSRPRPAAARPARCGCSPACATSATSSTRSASTTASTPTGERVEAVVADVENIPWGERHAYVWRAERARGPVLSDELDKTLHVSPLMGMDQTYAFRATEPGERALRPHRVAPARRARASPSTRPSRCAGASSAPRLLARPARPLPGDVAAGGGEDLRPVAAAEAEGRALLPPPRGEAPEGVPLAVRDALARGRGLGGAAPRVRSGRIDVVEAGARSAASARPTPSCGRRVDDQRPGRLARAAARQRRPRRGLRRRPLGDRRPRRADPDRRPRAARSSTACAAPSPARAAWLHRAPPPRPRQHPRPARARNISAHYDLGNDLFASFLDERMIYSCAYFAERGREPRGGAAGEARADLRAAAPRPREPPAGDRHRLGRAGDPRRPRARLPGDDDDDLPRAARAGDASGCARPASRTGSRSCSRTTATCAAATTGSSRSR